MPPAATAGSSQPHTASQPWQWWWSCPLPPSPPCPAHPLRTHQPTLSLSHPRSPPCSCHHARKPTPSLQASLDARYRLARATWDAWPVRGGIKPNSTVHNWAHVLRALGDDDNHNPPCTDAM
jgi:hypothetical protein